MIGFWIYYSQFFKCNVEKTKKIDHVAVYFNFIKKKLFSSSLNLIKGDDFIFFHVILINFHMDIQDSNIWFYFHEFLRFKSIVIHSCFYINCRFDVWKFTCKQTKRINILICLNSNNISRVMIFVRLFHDNFCDIILFFSFYWLKIIERKKKSYKYRGENCS